MAVVIPAAGRGLRFGSAENKIWSVVAGQTLLEHTLDAFQAHPDVNVIVLSCADFEMERVRAASRRFSKVVEVVKGGDTRSESVQNGLSVLSIGCEFVLVHDAARPAVSQQLISRVIAEVRRNGTAIPGLPVTDSIRRHTSDWRVSDTLDRSNLSAVQTPQAARLEYLLTAYKKLGADAYQQTDEAGVLQAGGFPVYIMEGDPDNLKVTTSADLARAEYLLSGSQLQDIRTGVGYDVHQFETGRELWLGGVKFDHSAGLKGHSDADVVLHAVCDAILGAASEGDIGVLFPDTDAKHKNRKSIEFVEEVKRLISDNGWSINNVDIALLLEEPKVMSKRKEMCDCIATALQISSDRVNIKATTAEKMGFVGNKEGAACWAVATLSR